MIQDILTKIREAGSIGIISLILFFAMFGIMVVWVLSLRKSYLNKMKNLPLDSERNGESSGNSNHEQGT